MGISSEKALVAAIVARAVRDYLKGNKREREAAKWWLLHDEREGGPKFWPGGWVDSESNKMEPVEESHPRAVRRHNATGIPFRWAMEVLEIDPDRFRAEIVKPGLAERLCSKRTENGYTPRDGQDPWD